MKRLSQLANRAWAKLPLDPRLITILVIMGLWLAHRDPAAFPFVNPLFLIFQIIAGVWAYLVYRERQSSAEHTFSPEIGMRAMAGTIVLGIVTGIFGYWFFPLETYTRVSTVIWAYLVFQVSAYPRGDADETYESPMVMYVRWKLNEFFNRNNTDSSRADGAKRK